MREFPSADGAHQEKGWCVLCMCLKRRAIIIGYVIPIRRDLKA